MSRAAAFVAGVGLTAAVAVIATIGVPAWVQLVEDSERAARTTVNSDALASPSPTGGTHGDGYARALFGRAWADVDSNGCDTRNDTLAVWLPDEQLATDGCAVTAGSFTDPYNSRQLTFRVGNPQPVQIDHVFPLHAAWHAGAAGWTDDQRLLFANDPSNLIPTTLNSTKGDRLPAALAAAAADPESKWKPTPAGVCLYARTFTLTATEWQLQLDAADRAALAQMLRDC